MSFRGLVRGPSARIALGLAIGQGFVLGVTPLLTRLYSNDEMGVAAVILAIAGIATAIGTLRVELLIPTADPAAVRWMCTVGLTSLAIVSLLTAAGTLLLAGFDAVDAVLLAVIIFAMGATALTLQLAARGDALGGVAVAKGAQGVTQGASQLLLGWGGMTLYGMPIGYAVGYCAAALTQWVSLLRRGGRRASKQTIRTPSGHARPVIGRMAILTLAALTNAGAVSALPLLIQFFFGEGSTGELAVAQRFAVMPAAFIVAAFMPVVAARFGALIRSGKSTQPEVRRWLKRMAPVGVIVAGVLAFVPDSWIEVLLGPGWEAVGDYMRALSVGIAFQIIVGPLGQVLALQGRVVAQFAWDAVRLVSLIAACAITARVTGDPIATVFSGSLVLAASYAAYLILIRRERVPS